MHGEVLLIHYYELETRLYIEIKFTESGKPVLRTRPLFYTETVTVLLLREALIPRGFTKRKYIQTTYASVYCLLTLK